MNIAVGNRSSVERVKSLMCVGIGRKSIEVGDSYQLREPSVPHNAHFDGKKDDIGPENIHTGTLLTYNIQ